MIARRLILLAMLASPLPALAAVAPPAPSVPSPRITGPLFQAGPYPTPQVVFPNGVVSLPGLVYSEPLGYRGLTLDLYQPPRSLVRPPRGFPLVVFVHGGSWLGGDPRSNGPFVGFPGLLAGLAARGYVVASVSYRFSSEALFPAQSQDVKTALRWLRQKAPAYGIDPTRAATWGASAGGHLAAMEGVSCRVAALEPARPAVPTAGPDRSAPEPADCVQASVAWYGVFDMGTMAAQSRQDGANSRDVPSAVEWRLIGCFAAACRAGQIAAASPVSYVDRTDPPMLLITGDADTVVPYHQTLQMADRLKAAGVPYELIVLPGINHSFLGRTPELTREANLKAIDATFKFLDRTLKAPR